MKISAIIFFVTICSSAYSQFTALSNLDASKLTYKVNTTGAVNIAAPPVVGYKGAQLGLIVPTYDPSVPVSYITVIDAVCQNLSLEINSTIPITVFVKCATTPVNVLASAYPTYMIPASYITSNHSALEPFPIANTVYPVALANKLTHQKIVASTFDINVTITTNLPAGIAFGLTTTGACASNEVDLYTLALHEMCHGLGFYGSAKLSSGQPIYGKASATNPSLFFPTVFDQFIKNSSSVALSSFPVNASSGGLTSFLTNPLSFTGTYALIGQSQVKIFSPSTFLDGSSESHLDKNTYPVGNANGLQTNGLGTQEAYHNIGSIVRGTFKDIGWDVNNLVGLEDYVKIKDYSTSVTSPSLLSPGQSLNNYYFAQFTDLSPYGDYLSSTNWSIRLYHTAGVYTLFTASGNLMSGTLPSIPAGYSWLRNPDGTIRASLNLLGIDGQGYTHSDDRGLGINYSPEKPILSIAPYVDCSNKSKLSFYSKGASGYYVLYGTTVNGPYPNSIYVPATQGFYNVTSLSNGSHYYFTVNAVNNNGFSPNAIEVNQIIANSGSCGIIIPPNQSRLAQNDYSGLQNKTEDVYKVWVSGDKELTLTMPPSNVPVIKALLYNNLGQIVSELAIPSMEAEMKWVLNKNIDSGIYFIVMYGRFNESLKKQNLFIE